MIAILVLAVGFVLAGEAKPKVDVEDPSEGSDVVVTIIVPVSYLSVTRKVEKPVLDVEGKPTGEMKTVVEDVVLKGRPAHAEDHE